MSTKSRAGGRLGLGWRPSRWLLLPFWAVLAGPPAVAEEKPAVVKLWDHHVHDKKFRQNIFKSFNKANPDIKVEYTSQISTTYETVLDAAFRAGTAPDIFVPMGQANLPKLVELGWVIPSTTWLRAGKSFKAGWRGFRRRCSPLSRA